MAVSQFLLAVVEQLRERTIDVAEAKEAEVVSVNAYPSSGG